MAVVKLTRSKKAVQFIADDGTVYQTSVLWLSGLLSGNTKHGFVKLSKLPLKVSKDRFEQSEVFGADKVEEGEVSLQEDALTVKTRTERQQAKTFEDKNVW